MASTTRMISGAPTPGTDAPASAPGVWLTELMLLAMAAIWGVNFSVVKFGTQAMSALAFNGLRVMLAAAALFSIALLARRPWPARPVAMRLVALGVLGNGLYQLLFVSGLARTRAGDAALVIAATPAFIAIIGRLRGTEHISRRAAAGIVLSIAGIGLVVFGGASSASGDSTLTGGLLVLAASLCWSVYTVLLQPHTGDVDGVALSALTMLGGVPPLLLAGAGAMASTRWSQVSAAGWGAVAYSGLAALVVAYLFWYRGVRVIGPTRTAMFANLQPAIALAVAWLTLGEQPRATQLLGAAAIFAGLVLSRRPGRPVAEGNAAT